MLIDVVTKHLQKRVKPPKAKRAKSSHKHVKRVQTVKKVGHV